MAVVASRRHYTTLHYTTLHYTTLAVVSLVPTSRSLLTGWYLEALWVYSIWRPCGSTVFGGLVGLKHWEASLWYGTEYWEALWV